MKKRYGTRKDVCDKAGFSVATLQRIEKHEGAPQPKCLPTGGRVRDLDAWDEYLENLPTDQSGDAK